MVSFIYSLSRARHKPIVVVVVVVAGFTTAHTSCCNVDTEVGGLCLPNTRPCSDRSAFVFWDAYHPTAAVNVIIAREAFHGGADVVAPINVGQLARL